MATFNGVSKVKKSDGTYIVRITNGDMELEPIDERTYKMSMMKPYFDDLPEAEWLPPEFDKS